jgi:hypothetical protein
MAGPAGEVLRTAADVTVLLLVLGVSVGAGALFGSLVEERQEGILEGLRKIYDADRIADELEGIR